jgi:hypothetical protein
MVCPKIRDSVLITSHESFTRLDPDSIDLFLYLDDFLLVRSSFMVRDLSFKLRHLFEVLPGVSMKTQVVLEM